MCVNNSNVHNSYYNSVKNIIKKYAIAWNLSNLKLLDDGEHRCILKGFSKEYGNIILKKQIDRTELEKEYHTLKEYNGVLFCKVYNFDYENSILLEEHIIPGRVLKSVNTLEERLEIFCNLHKTLHISSYQPEIYPTYLDWVAKATKILEHMESHKELYMHMLKAELICEGLFNNYSKCMLLHGDLHHHNILLNCNGRYTIIDPKGVLGDPIFDLPRFILNEMETEITSALMDKINYIIRFISQKLNVPIQIVKQLFYMEMCLSYAWNAQDGGYVNMQNVLFAFNYLK